MASRNRSSDRSFGIMWVIILTVISLLPLLKGGQIRWWALCIMVATGAITLFRPRTLAPLNAAWLQFSVRLQSVTSPIILGFLYFGLITPAAWLFRICGRRTMPLGFEPAEPSYWRERKADGDNACDFGRPF